MACKVTKMPFPTVAMSVSVLVVMLMHLQCLEAQQQPIVEGLSWNFYESSCPNLESIIRTQIERVIAEDVTLAAALLRVHFHDCFVQGCDGSVLLNGSASGPVDSEQTAPPNLSLRGFSVIEDIRSRVHNECGAGTVSCADITALVARDTVVLTGGPEYSVPLGRRDGLTFATVNATLGNLPSPFVPTDTLLTDLAARNFDATDVVALSGGHTLGVADCSSFARRLYPTQDTTMDETFANTLRGVCPSLNTTNVTTSLDIRSPNLFDNRYFVSLINNQGLLTSDQDLFTDERTRDIVTSFANNQTLFYERFVDVMVKMGQMQVLTGTQGEIRNTCSSRNSDNLVISNVVDGRDMNKI
ncbi:peroxidase 12-like [Bidens hawaiensis]|uniref:peroxidase 12-like n=1 Tax=Bidens hawaiensis TaxID=980011 RepID=UPI004049743D